jgi:N-acetylneuraminic acid mutarotase
MLTFEERVAYQYAIEEVYWRHRIWPKDNPDPKPSLDVVVSQREIAEKVEDYLRKSQLGADRRGSPITVSELQAEMERMATHTRDPDMLRELFVVLGNDPFVIGECLARPILAERLVSKLTGHNGVVALASNSTALHAVSTPTTQYKLPEISVPLDCIDNTWTATTTVNAPEPRTTRTAVWTGSEMIIWGGGSFNGGLNTGGRYDPALDTWTATSTTNTPEARGSQSTVWTGTELIIWGGLTSAGQFLNTGGRYNPISDSWTPTSTTNPPAARATHTAVWTGSEMIIWGGTGCGGNCNLNSGGRYNPGTDSWTTTSTVNAPAARWDHRAVWTGNQMIVWGGSNDINYLHTGGRYSPATDSWMPTGLVNVPLGRIANTAVWSGSEMIVWGGVDETDNDCNTGGRYNPSMDSWTGTNLGNAPSPRDSHTAVWTGSEMIVWGGVFCCPVIDFNTGGRYDAGIDSWTATSTANAPFARYDHTAVWTGSEMIVWSGFNYEQHVYLNTGGRYCAQSGATATPTPTATPMVTATPTATPAPTCAAQFRVLIAYADSEPPTELQNAIAAEPGVIAVDLFDAFSGTPTLQQLEEYNIVYAFSNSPWNDAVAMGNVLADYEDAGGVVTVGTFAWDSRGPWLLQGRWMTGGYSPYNSTNISNFSNNTANITDPGHPLMQGVTTLTAFYRNGLTLASGASSVAMWTDGPSAVGYQTNNGHTAAGINAYLGDNAEVAQFARVIVNAGRWLLTCPTPTPTPTATTTSTPSATSTPRLAPTPRPRPTPAPRP